MGVFGRTGGAGGSPPPKAIRFGSFAGSNSSIRRAVEDLAIVFHWNMGIMDLGAYQYSIIPSIAVLFPSNYSILNNKDNHGRNIKHNQQRQY